MRNLGTQCQWCQIEAGPMCLYGVCMSSASFSSLRHLMLQGRVSVTDCPCKQMKHLNGPVDAKLACKPVNKNQVVWPWLSMTYTCGIKPQQLINECSFQGILI